ncbi:UvrD-helicase domain-containing protein [Mesonia maritima]|uniref:UvrD-helicase domain-containing protein n=1 Tax=Mesonia maritima TaxID=1793873 RepID=UPI003637B24D
MQWKNLIPLIDNSLASATGSLSLVGDAKQSIYRWRGGKAEQFMALSQEVNPFSIQQEIIKLPANYRSSKEIVAFNNNFFKHVSQFLSFEPYQYLFQQANQEIIKSSSGYVNLNFIEATNKEEELEVYPQQVLETILNVEEKGYFKKDICILVRKKEEGIAIANYLNEHEIPIISSETLLINQSPSVHFIVSLLQFSVRPNDANIKFEVLDFIFENFSTTENHFTFFEARLAANEQAFFDQFTAQSIYFSLAILQRLPLYDAVEYIIRSFSLTAKANAYLQFFLDVIYEFTQKFSSGLSGFLEYWEQKKDKLSIVVPEGENAVQIMTIHKSKGLEFPIVIYPFANQSLSDTRLDNLWIPLEEKPNEIPLAYLAAQKKMLHYSENSSAAYQELLFQNELDALNVLYVALTRAEKQLYIISKLDLDRKGEEKINTFSGLVINYLKTQQLWKTEKTEYEFGNLTENNSEEKIELEKEKNSTFVSTSPADHNLSIITKSGSLWQTRQEEAINRGELVHEILQQIITKNDVSEVLEKFILEGFISTEEKQNFKKLIENVVNHSQLEEYFTDKYEIFNEKEILNKGNFIRLDRLCLLKTNAIIIDYKTGNFSENHVNQINSYAEAISEMNYTVTKKLLVYLNDEVTVKNV